MTDDNSNPVDMDDLNAFEDALFERTPETEVAEEEVADEENDEEVEENEEVDPLANDDDDEDGEDDAEDEAEEEPEPKPKAKRNRTQERIEQLVAEARVAERERDAARRELEQLKAGTEVKPVAETSEDKSSAPKPDALDEKGEAVYPLGEFDPQYITDLSRFTAAEMMKEYQNKQAEEARNQEILVAQAALKETWQENLERAEEELPDIREKIGHMAEAFEGIDPAYGEYLAGTIMSCEHGPEIMYYLSQNIGEAQKIVASGLSAATLAIGRLEARFEKPTQEVKRNKRVSDAPKPPEQRTRGTGGRFAIRPDTDDLAAFERDFFK